VSFADAGLPSTIGELVVPSARGCLAAAGVGTDIIVAELGDGLLGEYGVRDVMADPHILHATRAVVLAANDPVGAYGGAAILEQLGHQLTVVTGPATDNSAGNDAISAHAGAPAANARKEGKRLAEIVLSAVRLALVATPMPLEMSA